MNAEHSTANILEEIYGPAGYSTAFRIDADELTFFRDAISAQWITRIEAAHPEHAAQFREAGLEQYHALSHLVSHSDLWPKEARVLSREAVATLSDFKFVRRLRSHFGADCRISDVTFFSESVAGYPEVYWRLVRPGVKTDVGGMHTDRWFHDILGDGAPLFSDDETTIKMWLPIFTEPGRNGLYVVPGSHRKDWTVKYTPGSDGFPRPALDEALDDDARVLLPVEPGQAILFNENLLHGGAVNAGSTSRVSIEITFVLKRVMVPQ
ncbi:Phytanoyl-CoA dioxygenase [Pararobbsia alpina]|uniref:phytanoyl-CoA dioxygenase family protein n=1 Tax=Pararobbsia alpina TaxID=621374 RepID=UPI0039A5A6BF